MVTHVVLFKLQDPANVEATRAVLATMPEHMPQLRYIEVGADAEHSERSYHLSLITRFDSWEDLAAYRMHPYHLEVVNAHLATVVESVATVDYEAR